jgi:CBS-domain-containing membrane protein
MAELRRCLIRLALVWITVIVGLGATLIVVSYTGHPWLLASLGGSCVILYGMPNSDMAQPRSLFGGHLISTTVGILFLKAGFDTHGGNHDLWMMAALATALVLMIVSRTIHSPAGANPIVIFMEKAGWSLLLSPLLVGLLILFLAALVVCNWGGLSDQRYPRTWS